MKMDVSQWMLVLIAHWTVMSRALLAIEATVKTLENKITVSFCSPTFKYFCWRRIAGANRSRSCRSCLWSHNLRLPGTLRIDRKNMYSPWTFSKFKSHFFFEKIHYSVSITAQQVYYLQSIFVFFLLKQ